MIEGGEVYQCLKWYSFRFTSLENVPLLPAPVESSSILQPIELCEDSYQEVMDQLAAKATKAGLIDEESVLQIVCPHLYGDFQDKFKQLLKNLRRPISSDVSLA